MGNGNGNLSYAYNICAIVGATLDLSVCLHQLVLHRYILVYEFTHISIVFKTILRATFDPQYAMSMGGTSVLKLNSDARVN